MAIPVTVAALGAVIREEVWRVTFGVVPTLVAVPVGPLRRVVGEWVAGVGVAVTIGVLASRPVDIGGSEHTGARIAIGSRAVVSISVAV